MLKPVELKLNLRNNQIDAADACTGMTLGPDTIAFRDRQVYIDDVGWVSFGGPDTIPETFEQAYLTETGGRWHLTLYTPTRGRPRPPTGRKVGVDFGVHYLVFTSDGGRLHQNGDLVRLDKLVQKQLDQLDRKHIDSTRYREMQRRIAHNRKRMFDLQLDQANKIANTLVKRYDFIALEDINPNGKTIQHHPDYKLAAERSNWQLIIDTVKLRAHETGRHVVMVPPWFTSQMCGECGWYTPKPLDKRRHHCDRCGYTAERDLNAAKAILNRGIEVANGTRRTDWRPIGHPDYVPDSYYE